MTTIRPHFTRAGGLAVAAALGAACTSTSIPTLDEDALATTGEADESEGDDDEGPMPDDEGPHDGADDGDDAVCGNGEVEAGEDCDAGGTATSTCDSDCTAVECGDGITNILAGELCDDGNTDDLDQCGACAPLAFTVNEGYAADFFADVDVIEQEGESRFLLAYKDTGTVWLQTYRPDGELAWGPVTMATDQEVGMLDLIVGADGNGMVLWHSNTGDNWGVIRHQRFDAYLQNVSSTGEWPVLSFGRHAIGAAGLDGGICTTGWFSSVPIGVRCFDSALMDSGGSEFESTFGGLEQEGPHDLIATPDGYLLLYVPDDGTHDVVAYPLSPTGESTGPGFTVADFEDPYYSWVPRGAALGGSSFVALAGMLTDGGYGPWRLYYRVFEGADAPRTELRLVDDDEATKREGLVIAHESGRFLVAWIGGIGLEPEHGGLESCRVDGRVFDADGEPLTDTVVLHDPGQGVCARGLRGAADAEGNVMLTWSNLVIDESLADKRGAMLQGLLAP